MTRDETEVLVSLMQAWNRFNELPNLSADDKAEFRQAIHHLQEKVMARATARAYPEIFR